MVVWEHPLGEGHSRPLIEGFEVKWKDSVQIGQTTSHIAYSVVWCLQCCGVAVASFYRRVRRTLSVGRRCTCSGNSPLVSHGRTSHRALVGLHLPPAHRLAMRHDQ